MIPVVFNEDMQSLKTQSLRRFWNSLRICQWWCSFICHLTEVLNYWVQDMAPCLLNVTLSCYSHVERCCRKVDDEALKGKKKEGFWVRVKWHSKKQLCVLQEYVANGGRWCGRQMVIGRGREGWRSCWLSCSSCFWCSWQHAGNLCTSDSTFSIPNSVSPSVSHRNKHSFYSKLHFDDCLYLLS